MTEPERAAEWSIATGYMVTSPSSWASRPMKAYVAAFPSLDAARSQLPDARSEISTHANLQVVGALNKQLVEALAGRKSPAAALHDAQLEAEALLRPFR
jgi:sn-glycerol 3-phosphate transport system substrate-binding protein